MYIRVCVYVLSLGAIGFASGLRHKAHSENHGNNRRESDPLQGHGTPRHDRFSRRNTVTRLRLASQVNAPTW